MDVAKFKVLPLLGILRDIEQEIIEPLIETIIASGLKTIEITMNTKNAAALIRRAVELSGKQLVIGAGTVLTSDDLKSALDAGATFIVTPVLVKEVLGYCLKNKIPIFPGALTPQEIYTAWFEGVTMVKVFPAKFFGPEYFKEIKGPFKEIKLLACAGVTAENLKSYFSNGADAVSFGASVFRQDWLKEKDFSSIKRSIKEYLQAFRGQYA
ncbi:MAG: bifunctional 4-hydroxy-2-oxoglutarate aldolase/2-dehydro-3-deoxy-phosphogluconate aldolase [Candidatus Omnitrophica bacterium]|jgi:2-dehydro-3-deoxyphosphogluconate aldolase/(4S)-4-hydroxy-2-oxoglutarate aldolase|nr:bifunctional 4-hydroxy-2-oxoglutarate aldolase/2-dehydro-3-deoxy-phosphogluconate aldolase [Candidatus Omnitrophota bacterium]